MKIAIIGAGNVGTALATGWVRAGHSVTFGVRDERSRSSLEAGRRAGADVASVAGAAAGAEVIVIATPPTAARSVVDELGSLKGKVVIDATNSIRYGPESFTSVAAAIKAWTDTPDVVKCFNSVGFEIMADPEFGEHAADMFVAGDSGRGKQVASQLALDLGFGACHDFGGDDRFALLEQLALCWIDLAVFQGQGRHVAFKVLRRQ